MAKQTTSTPQPKAASGSPSVRSRSTAAGATRAGDAGARRGAPNLTGFFRDSYAELRKCTWPTRQETMNLTVAVVAMTLAIAVFLGVIDASLDKVVSWLIG